MGLDATSLISGETGSQDWFVMIAVVCKSRRRRGSLAVEVEAEPAVQGRLGLGEVPLRIVPWVGVHLSCQCEGACARTSSPGHRRGGL